MKKPKEMIDELMSVGLTQDEIASAVGLSQGRVSHISTGGGSCSYEAGLKLKALHDAKLTHIPATMSIPHDVTGVA